MVSIIRWAGTVHIGEADNNLTMRLREIRILNTSGLRFEYHATSMRNVLLAFITKIRILNSRRYYAIVEVTLRNLSAIRQNPLACHMQMRARERLVRINDETELPLNNSHGRMGNSPAAKRTADMKLWGIQTPASTLILSMELELKKCLLKLDLHSWRRPLQKMCFYLRKQG